MSNSTSLLHTHISTLLNGFTENSFHLAILNKNLTSVDVNNLV